MVYMPGERSSPEEYINSKVAMLEIFYINSNRYSRFF